MQLSVLSKGLLFYDESHQSSELDAGRRFGNFRCGEIVGKFIVGVKKSRKISTCTHIPTKVKDGHTVGSSCDPVDLYFGPIIVVEPAIDTDGDSGALVLTTGSCPQPVGIIDSGGSDHTNVAPLPGVLAALVAVGGLSSLSVVPPAGSACNTNGQAYAEAADGSVQIVNTATPDPDVMAAIHALPDFLGSTWPHLLMQEGVVVSVGIDYSKPQATLDVTADDGTFEGVNDFAYASGLIPTSFEGVPVEVTKIQTDDMTGESGGFVTN